MLMLGQKVRFCASELADLRKLTGPCYFEPRTVRQLNQLCAQAQAHWTEVGVPRLAAAVGKINVAN